MSPGCLTLFGRGRQRVRRRGDKAVCFNHALRRRLTPTTRLPYGFTVFDRNGDQRPDLIGVDGAAMRVFINPGNRTAAGRPHVSYRGLDRSLRYATKTAVGWRVEVVRLLVILRK